MSGTYKIVDQHATYFITCTIVGWIDLFTRKQCRQFIIDSLKYCQEHKGLIIYAYVIMPSHLHFIVSCHESNKAGLSGIIRDFKRATSKKIIEWINCSRKESRRHWLNVVFKYHGKYNKNNEVYQVWIQNNHPVLCIHPRFTRQKLNYIHKNPVAAGIVDHPEDYIFSSARNYAMMKDIVLDVKLLDYGPEVGYVFT